MSGFYGRSVTRVSFHCNIDCVAREVWPSVPIECRPVLGEYVESDSGLRLQVVGVTFKESRIEVELHLPKTGQWENIAKFEEWYDRRKNRI